MVDKKEFELPDTVFVRDIESRLIQSLVLRSLCHVEGVYPIEAGFFDQLLGDKKEAARGVVVDQDEKSHAVSVKVEVNIQYGLSIPQKAEEIQAKIAQDISCMTGLRVSAVHVVFKNLVFEKHLSSDAGK